MIQFRPNAPIINRETGEPLTEPKPGGTKVVTHGLLVVRALDAKLDSEKIDPKDGYARFLLGNRIIACTGDSTVDLTIEEAALIRSVVAIAYPSGVFGQIWLALDNATRLDIRDNRVVPAGSGR